MATPYIYYVLFDTIKVTEIIATRVRVWRVSPATDQAYQKVLTDWISLARSINFQLHPPVGKSSNIATNMCGNLELPLIFEAQTEQSGEFSVKHLDLSNSSQCVFKERPAITTKKINPKSQISFPKSEEK